MATILLFLVGCVTAAGVAVQRGQHSRASERAATLSLLDTIQEPPGWTAIMKANVRAFLLFEAGLVSAGLFAIFGVFAFGLEFGAALSAAANQGLGWKPITAAIAPHGVVELPALLLGGACGLYGFVAVVRVGEGGFHRDEWRCALAHIANLTALAVLALGAAAAIEVWLTPVVIRWAACAGSPLC